MHTGILAILGATLVAGGGLLLLPAEGGSKAGGAALPPGAQYIAAAQDTIRSRLRQAEEPRFEKLEVFRFGPADERAVCGMVQPSGGAGIPFVVRVLLPREQAPRPAAPAPRYLTVLEQGPGLVHADGQAAARYCREGGTVAAATFAPTAEPEPVRYPVESMAREIVVIRSPARLRAAPGGEVLRIAAQGEELAVFDRAPGGWLRVGMAAPQGWVHASMLANPR